MRTMGRRAVLASAGLIVLAPRSALAAGKTRVVITTRLGAITIELENQKAPLTCANFLRYVDAAKYDGGRFFRAARRPGSPTQGTIVASPNVRAQPFPPIAHESTTKTGLKHRDGAVSLGRFSPGTGRGDFFICVGAQPYLDARPGAPGDNLGYAVFGQVVNGMSVVRRILGAPTSQESEFKEQRGQWLKPPIPIVSARRA